MKRRLKILLGTFGVIISAFLLYYLVSDKDFSSVWSGRAPATRPADEGTSPVPGIGDVGPIRGFERYTHDKHHRLQGKYTAGLAEMVGEKIYLTEPKVELYMRNGELITIQAERGIIVTSEAAGEWNVRSGMLRDKDKIRITIDRSRNVDPDRPPLEQRPDDALIIQVGNEVNFDNEMLTILSDGSVSVHSKEADIFGKGLRIAWNEAPRQLRELRIAHGDRMVIREGKDQFIGGMSLPSGADTDKSTPTESESPKPSAEPKPSVARAETPPTLPTTMPTTVPAEPAPVVEDAYVVTFNDNVVVTSGNQRMTGADKLRLVFEFKRPDRDEPQSSTRPDEEKKTPTIRLASKTAASRPSDAKIATTQPADVKTVTTQPADEMVITWTGPLVLKPFRSYEEPIPKRFDVTVTGKELTLVDDEAVAVCSGLEFRSPGQGGTLIGTTDKPVSLKMASGESIIVPKIRFNRFNSDTTVVYLDGAGEMHLPESAAAALNFSGSDDEQPEKKKREAVTIKWTEKVEAAIGSRKVKTETGVENEDFPRWAVFVGDVDVRQGETQSMKADKLTAKFHPPASADEKVNRMASLYAAGNVEMNDTKSGEYIKSQKLDVQMSGPEEEKAYARKVVATGDVSAMQAKREIKASKSMTITFAPQKDEKTGKIEIKPQQLDAVGDVKITDRSEKDTVVIEAETLTSNLSAKTATLKGKPATVKQKDNIIRGRKILFDQAKESANVAGAGSLRFDTDTDISGNKFEKPKPMDIAWDDEMDYRGKQRTAIILGAVNIKMSGDKLDCGKVTIVFDEPEDDAATRPVAETKPGEFASFRPQKIKTVIAEKKVRMESQRWDKDGFLLQRMRLRSEHVIYEVDLGVLSCPKAGTFIAEDYRPPEKKKAGRRRDDLAGSIDRPSQSAFRWSESMKMNQTTQTVWLTGKVRMVHCSGKNMVRIKQLNIRPWGKLPEGRNTVLDCEKMKACFAEPKDKVSVKAGTVPISDRSWVLDLFDATGDVKLEDGPRQVVCQRILYQRNPADTAIIWGSLPGEPKKNAIMYYRDVQRGVLNSWKNPKLIWYRATNRVEGKGVEVRGGR